MKIDLETRIAIRNMLKSPDSEIFKLGWVMFVDTYQEEIIYRLKTRRYFNMLTNSFDAIEFLTRSIANSKRRKNGLRRI